MVAMRLRTTLAFMGGGSPSYLRVIQELLECWDDNLLRNIHTELQDVIDRECGRALSERRFSERYKRNESSLHLHASRHHLRRKERFQFCTSLSATNGEGFNTVLENGNFSTVSLRINHIQVSVLVDVRELSQKPKLIGRIPTIIRLQTLDECKRLLGNTRKGLPKVVEWQRKVTRAGRISCSGDLSQEGKLATPNPVSGQLDCVRIKLDEIECQVIECRPDLIRTHALPRPRQSSS